MSMTDLYGHYPVDGFEPHDKTVVVHWRLIFIHLQEPKTHKLQGDP